MDSGIITMTFILTLLIFGIIAIPLFIYEAVKNFSKMLKHGKQFVIEVNKDQEEFEELLKNIVNTHANYYGSRIKIKKR